MQHRSTLVEQQNSNLPGGGWFMAWLVRYEALDFNRCILSPHASFTNFPVVSSCWRLCCLGACLDILELLCLMLSLDAAEAADLDSVSAPNFLSSPCFTSLVSVSRILSSKRCEQKKSASCSITSWWGHHLLSDQYLLLYVIRIQLQPEMFPSNRK